MKKVVFEILNAMTVLFYLCVMVIGAVLRDIGEMAGQQKLSDFGCRIQSWALNSPGTPKE